MFNHKSLSYIVGVGVTLGLLASCYQKKGAQNKRAVIAHEEAVESDTLIESFDPNSVAFVDTFKLVATEKIFASVQKNARRKAVYKLPKMNNSDSLTDVDFIEQLAVTNVYAAVGKLSKNKTLTNLSLKQNEQLIAKIIDDTLDYPSKQPLDSIHAWTAFVIPEHASQNEWVYFEAIQWLENLYLTIENPTNTINKKKLEELVLLQIENGSEMLERLSAYQDYQPIAFFAEHLINILDCKYFTFDAKQLKEEVVDARELLYIIKEK